MRIVGQWVLCLEKLLFLYPNPGSTSLGFNVLNYRFGIRHPIHYDKLVLEIYVVSSPWYVIQPVLYWVDIITRSIRAILRDEPKFVIKYRANWKAMLPICYHN